MRRALMLDVSTSDHVPLRILGSSRGGVRGLRVASGLAVTAHRWEPPRLTPRTVAVPPSASTPNELMVLAVRAEDPLARCAARGSLANVYVLAERMNPLSGHRRSPADERTPFEHALLSAGGPQSDGTRSGGARSIGRKWGK